MYGSPAMSKDLDLSFSDLNGQHQLSSGLLRYRSAPSSLFEDFLPPRSSSPEADTVLARFLSSDLRDDKPGSRGSPRYPPPLPQPQPQPPQAAAEHGGVAPDPRMLYQQPRQQLPGHGAADGSYRAAEAEQLKSVAGLVRQSSSPAGLFSHLNVENGYAFMRSMSGLRNGNGSIGEAGANRLKNQISFSSRQSSIMSQISEVGSEGMGASSPEESSLASNGGGRCYIPGYPITSWDDSPILPDNFSNLKRAREASHNQSEPQNGGENRSHASGQLAHQFSLPKTSSEIAAMEKFLQFQDAVPCKIRAKRGCATHPRSIAERVRRTRISERMRKLQELVPNMDKQTNTADMLDLAVDYIKELQRQVKSLSDSRASCSCSSGKQKPYTAV